MTVADRALAYLADGRLRVPSADLVLVVDGTDATHVVAHSPRQTVCTCPAWRPCTHLAAAALIAGPAPLPDLAQRCPCCTHLPGPHPAVWPHRRDRTAAHYRCPRTGHPFTDPTRRLP